MIIIQRYPYLTATGLDFNTKNLDVELYLFTLAHKRRFQETSFVGKAFK